MLEQMGLFGEKGLKSVKKEKQPASKKPAVRRRKKATAEVENYYALLGVPDDADLATVKENYIKMVKKYPPESHAEKFRRIRQAYEVLQDEQKRKEYDILFLYGESVNDLLAEASSGRRPTTAKVTLLERAVKIDPFHAGAQLTLAEAYLIREGRAAFEERFDIIKNTFGAEKWSGFSKVKVQMLLKHRGPVEAFDELQRLQEAAPRIIGEYCHTCLDVYGALDRETELLDAFAAYHQSLTRPAIEDLVIYTGWIQIADMLFEEDKLPEARRAAEKFIRSFSTQAEREQIAGLLTEEYQEALEARDIRCAKILVDLACFADRNNKKLKQYSQDLQKTTALIDEITRAFKDDKIFTPIILEILPDFISEFDIEDTMFGVIAEQYDEHGREYFEEMAARINVNELYAAGIFRLKKRYPLLYRKYQAQWERILTEKTMGMNREERRSFRW